MYDTNERITFSVTISGTTPTQIFTCPYGQNVRFMLKKLTFFNQAVTPTNIKIWDQIQASTITDPPTQGSATAPLLQISSSTSAGLDSKTLGLNETPELIFQQGMTVQASQGTVVVTATVVEV